MKDRLRENVSHAPLSLRKSASGLPHVLRNEQCWPVRRPSAEACLEFKASHAVETSDARHLRTLRDDLGVSFLAGAVLYSGKHLVELDDRIYGIPLCSIWT